MIEPFSMPPSTPRTTAPDGLDSSYIQPTFQHALRIWWAFYWPWAIGSTLFDIGWRSSVSMSGAFPMLFGFVLGYYVMYYVLGRRFRGFRVALVDEKDFSHLQEVPRTFDRVVRIWWAYTWRVWLTLYIAGGSVYLLFGGFVNSVVVSRTTGAILDVAMYMVFAGAAGLYVFYDTILDDVFAGARVCILQREAGGSNSQANAAAPAPIA
jgi:hypothetical protein